MSTKMKYILIGNIIKTKEIVEFPKTNEQHVREAKQIFNQLCKTNYNKFEERQQIVSSTGNFYFTSSQSGDFFIAFVESNYSERYVYEFFENVQNEQIINFVDERGEINSDGKFKLKALFEKYEDVKNMNSIIAANLEIDGVRTQMKNNIKGMMNNLNSLNDLDNKARNIKEGSLLYQKDAVELERVTWWQNCKLTLIICGILIVLFLSIGLPLILKIGGSSSSNTSSTTTNNTISNNTTNTTTPNSTRNGTRIFL